MFLWSVPSGPTWPGKQSCLVWATVSIFREEELVVVVDTPLPEENELWKNTRPGVSVWVLWPVWSLGEMSFPPWASVSSFQSERVGLASVVLNLSELFETWIKRHGLLGRMNTRGLASAGGAPAAHETRPGLQALPPSAPPPPFTDVQLRRAFAHAAPAQNALHPFAWSPPWSASLEPHPCLTPRLDEVTLLDVLPSPDHGGN